MDILLSKIIVGFKMLHNCGIAYSYIIQFCVILATPDLYSLRLPYMKYLRQDTITRESDHRILILVRPLWAKIKYRKKYRNIYKNKIIRQNKTQPSPPKKKQKQKNKKNTYT